MNIEDLVGKLAGVRPSGKGYTALCPAHDDTNASLSVSTGDSAELVVYCHAGCETKAVVTAMGLTMADLNGVPRLLAEYPYRDGAGQVIYTVQRWSGKKFLTSPAGVQPADRTLYQREAIDWARTNGSPLYLVEGEKDVDTLREHGIPATTASHGAKAAWLPQFTSLLAGCHVVIVADNDAPGIERGRRVYAEVRDACASVSLVKPAGDYKDVSDLYAAGYDLGSLQPFSEVSGLTILDAHTLTARTVAWAWKDHVPFGSITLIDGDPGSAKSTLTVDLVARWSRSTVMPDGTYHAGPFTSVMVSAEDDPLTTILPRLQAANADTHRVKLVTAGMREDQPFNLGVDFVALHRAMVEREARILVLDPLTAFLPIGADTKMDADVRRALGPLAHMARQLNIAVLVVRHLTKSATSAMYAGSGSVGFIAAARSAFMVTQDPSKGKEYRVLAPIKSNLAPMPPSLSYTVEPCVEVPGVANVQWHGQVVWDAQNLMDAKRGVEPRITKREVAREFLVDLLTTKAADGVAFMSWAELVDYGNKEALSEHTLRNAKDDLLTEGRLQKLRDPYLGDTGERVTGNFWALVQNVASTDGKEEYLPLAIAKEEWKPPLPLTSEDGKWQVLPPDGMASTEWQALQGERLESAPWACDWPNCPVEGADHVVKYGAPHYVVRCLDHLPPPDEDEKGLAE